MGRPSLSPPPTCVYLEEPVSLTGFKVKDLFDMSFESI